VKLFLLTIHIVLAAGILLGVSRRPDVVTAPAVVLLVILAATCSGLWMDRRWAAAPAAALGIGAASTGAMLLLGRAGMSGPLTRQIAAALIAVAIVEFATIAWALRKRTGTSDNRAQRKDAP
jgi:hypothetical protein